MIRIFIILAALFLLPRVAPAQEPAREVSIDDLRVVKISAGDGRAVIEIGEGGLQLIKAGDRIGRKAKVLEITTGRVVIEELTEQGAESVIIRLEDGNQRVERVRRAGKGTPPLHAVPPVREGGIESQN
jgi:Tfp pilus assembly protein PilP